LYVISGISNGFNGFPSKARSLKNATYILDKIHSSACLDVNAVAKEPYAFLKVCNPLRWCNVDKCQPVAIRPKAVAEFAPSELGERDVQMCEPEFAHLSKEKRNVVKIIARLVVSFNLVHYNGIQMNHDRCVGILPKVFANLHQRLELRIAFDERSLKSWLEN